MRNDTFFPLGALAILLFTGASFINGTPYTTFTNPSFESEVAKAGVFPDGWSSVTPDNSPDIIPGGWGIMHPAHEGKTCIGLVTRKDGSAENLGQKLYKPLSAGKCYSFSIWLSHAEKYVGFNSPCRLRVWGGSKPGSKEVTLANSTLISHTDWKEYTFTFTPGQNIDCITFEATFAPGATFKYNGNILLDLCSAIEICEKA